MVCINFPEFCIKMRIKILLSEEEILSYKLLFRHLGRHSNKSISVLKLFLFFHMIFNDGNGGGVWALKYSY